jgi:hypothetical protein
LSAAEEEEQAAKGDEREEQVANQRGDVALLLAFTDGDIDAILSQDVDEFRVVRQNNSRASTIDRGELQRRSILAEAHALHLAAHDGFDKLAVTPVVSFRKRVRGHSRSRLGGFSEHRRTARLLRRHRFGRLRRGEIKISLGRVGRREVAQGGDSRERRRDVSRRLTILRARGKHTYKNRQFAFT